MSDLKVIGAGLPCTGEPFPHPCTPFPPLTSLTFPLPSRRTGTASLRAALELLYHTKCFHMYEMLLSAQVSKEWIGAFEQLERGETVDFGPILAGYGCGVDSPIGDVYVQLAKQYPEAKVRDRASVFHVHPRAPS